MIRLSTRLLVTLIAVAAPLAAQAQPGTFTLPTPTPTPTPAPAGPADERAGVPIPPRAQPTATPEPRPAERPRVLATPILQPVPSPAPVQRAPAASPTRGSDPAASSSAPEAAPAPEASQEAPLPAAPGDQPALLLPSDDIPITPFGTGEDLLEQSALPGWWPYAAGGLGALVLLGGAALVRRRRKPKTLRLAGPLAAPAGPDMADEQPRLDLTLEITSATRSVMMFTVEYRLTIANRSQRAVTDLNAAVQLACARASAANAPSPGAAQGLSKIERVGPHQARSITGQVQLPLSAIAPMRQGTTPMFIPLIHITLEGAGLRALDKSFVIGTPSGGGAGRVHPILLDQPPGAVPGLVAQPIAIPPVSNAA
ncbi:MAG: hypothetical protein EDM03_11185 [Porphyrobacter sp. IPPAS B-1204]|nr:MAG: hypothetical protein EDM03_11185 [Porphyrobacter sp. IPPAS B-1204]